MTRQGSNGAPWLETAQDADPRPAKPVRKPRKTDPVPEEVKALIRARGAHLCELCYQSPIQHFHHRQLRRSGDHTARNIVGLCNTCHTRCHGHVRWALDTGWIVSQYDDPALREVLWRGKEWCWLGLDGSLLHLPPVQEPPC